MQEWLPLIAALIGALATFGIWAYASRGRLVRRAIDLEKALETVQQCVDRHIEEAAFLGVDPVMDPLRSDPRFQALLRRLGVMR